MTTSRFFWYGVVFGRLGWKVTYMGNTKVKITNPKWSKGFFILDANDKHPRYYRIET